MFSLLGLLVGLALLILLVLRGVELLVAAPLCALLVALASGFALFPQLAAEDAPSFTSAYMAGFVGFVQTWFFMFLLGSIFGKVMEATGAADSISRWIIGRLGRKHAAGAVVLACAVLTYGGVSLFVVAFSVYPMALAMFREANLPRRFIPGTIGFGSVTFTMTSAGSPEIQNWIPIKYLGTTPYAGWEVSLVCAIFMAIAGYLFLQRNLRLAVAGGEGFVARADDPRNDERDLPSPLTSMLPIFVVLVASFFLHKRLAESALIVSLGAGVLAGMSLNWRFMRGKVGHAMALGALGALVAIANTAAVVGFGGVAKLTPGFHAAVEFFTSLPGPPLLGAAVAVTLIAAMTGSASGGQTIALPIIAPHYLDAGVDPQALHRVVALASGGLDAMPHNGYVVTTIRAICKESYSGSYPMVFYLASGIPTIGMFVAVVLFSI
jgi:H+/gluconate symporter-like permease